MAARTNETSRRQITQQGVDFVWQVDSFEPLTAMPAQVTRSNTLGLTRTETTAYNNVAKWVLGQVSTVTDG